MTILHGPELTLEIGSEGPSYLSVQGLRLTSFVVGNEFVDDSNAGHGGWRSILSHAGRRTLKLGAKGLSLGSAGEGRLRGLALTGATENFRASLEDGWTLSARFAVSRLTYQGVWDDEPVFDVELESAGAVTIA